MATLRLIPLSGGEPIEISCDQVLMGRDASCDIVVSDGSVSRKHARIEKRGADWQVIDQGSANGTFLDSRRVADSALRNGQEIRFGAVGYRVEIEAATDRTMPAQPAAGDATVIQSEALTGLPSVSPPPASAPTAPLPKPHPPTGPPRPPALPPGRWSPPTGSPVPPMAGPPPASKGRGPLFWIATGCGGCLLVIVLLIAGIAVVATTLTKGVTDVVKAELADIRAGRNEQAYGRLSDSYQAKVSRPQFDAFIDSTPALRFASDSWWWSRSVSNNTARVSRQIQTPTGRAYIMFDLEKRDGEWRITRLRVNGHEPDESGSSEPPGSDSSS